jgi:flagellar biosynthesis anti-sigma factor FlgM
MNIDKIGKVLNDTYRPTTPAAPVRAPESVAQDQVVITRQAQVMQQVESRVTQSTGIDQQRVDRIRSLINSREYNIDPQRLADKILHQEISLT